MADLGGTRIADKYDLIRLLGQGGMGAVYEARQITTLKRCAVKVLITPDASGDAEIVARFFREARASGLIESEHVVAAFDSGTDADGRIYYVMECLQGEDLQRALRRVGPLQPEAAMKILWQAASGLAHAHTLGIVHRDVKPANLFLAAGERGEIKVKILDFGVAKMKKLDFLDDETHLTRTGSLLGTPVYMSPEHIKRASAIDESADVWSLGVVAFECLAGELPFGKLGSVGELIAAVLTNDVPDLRERAPWVSPELATIVQRALARDQEKRLRRAAEFRDVLGALLPGGTELSASEIHSVTEDQRKVTPVRLSVSDTVMMTGDSRPSGELAVPPAPRRRSKRDIALAAAIAGVVGAGAWTLGRPAPTESTSATPKAPSPPAPATNTVAAVSLPPKAASSVVEPSWLEVGPRDVQVSVDGAVVPVTDGRVQLRAAIGSVLVIRLSRGGRSVEQRVAITNDGPVPNRVTLGVRPAASAAATAAAAAHSGTSAEAAKPENVRVPLPAGLSQEFE